MKTSWRMRVLSAVLPALLVFSCIPPSAAATGSGVTIPGEAETIPLPTAASTERERNFNEGWKFYLGTSSGAQNPNFADSSWESVTLPHDFSITQNFTSSGEAESGFLPGGTGWYRKRFTLPAADAGKTVLLSFDGVYADAYVYVNGTKVGEHHYGYTSFAFDISDYLTCDGSTENVIAVKAVNNVPSSRWYSGSGIYRDVTLIVTDPVHVDYNGIQVTTPNISRGDGTVNAKIEVKNDGNTSASVTIKGTVLNALGATVAEAQTALTVGTGSTTTATVAPVVASPALWDIDSPNLYVLHTELWKDNVLLDSCDTVFGFRYFSFDSTGFHLNGRNVKLNGVCLHHDQGALGAAASYDAMYRQLSIMKDMGANAIRTSHNPADEHFIDICNTLGLLVIEEAFDGWNEAKNGNSNDFARYFDSSIGSVGLYGSNSSMTWAEFAIKSMVKRDRNDPSVILWSLCNEVQEGTNWTTVGSFADIAQNLIDWIKEVDTTRPATSGDNNRGGDSRLVAVLNTIRNNGGVVGFNYANSASQLYSLAQRYGGGVIIAAETASATNSRGIYTSQANNSAADGRYHLTSYDTSSVSWGIPAHDSIYNTYQYDCVAGEFVWTGFDYIGEPTPWNGTASGDSGRGAIPNSSYFGIVDTAGFEKDTYYLYRSQWNKDATTLHLVTAWDSDNMMTTNGKTPVVVYSNAPVVKLYRDGTLIGTATRETHTSSAGHTYYTYSVTSNNSSICSAVSASGSSSLYATFNVAYTAGTLSAKAFAADGTTELSLIGNSGRSSVTTPGTASRLVVSQNKSVIDADGESLVYITVDVTDQSGNLDTTATNTINFSLSGSGGEIVGVDNGDQATTAKYQQRSVLTGTTSAQIAAYAGKALVIVRSTKDAGSFTVSVSSNGLTGGSVSVTTKAVADTGTAEGLVSYTMVRDYTVRIGTVPEFGTAATGTMANGATASGMIMWEAIPETNMAGDYTVNGQLLFSGLDPILVTARLHVVDNVIALRNISAVTLPGTCPTLPGEVRGVLADGRLSGEFKVTWDTMSASQFATVGTVVTVNGTAAVFGSETLPVTCTVRVAEAVNTESVNVAPTASDLTQDIASVYQSDNLESIRNGTTKPGDNTSERWTNWKNRTNSATAALTFKWATAQMLSGVNLYYYYDNCCAKPQSVEFAYSLNGIDFTPIAAAEALVESYSLGAEYAYTFTSPVNPVALRITFTQQSGTTGANCVGLTECEIMTYAGKLSASSSAALSAIMVDGAALAGFAADTLSYTASGANVTAASAVNAGITVLPALNNVVRVLTVSEDGSAASVYTVTLTAACVHTTELRNKKDATCTEEGYTGDEVCTKCGTTVKAGTVIAKAAHTTELRNKKDATCTEEGYTGDKFCTVCETVVEQGKAVPAKGHSWDAGAATEDGQVKYTCTACGATKIEASSNEPSVTLMLEQNNGKIKMIGRVSTGGKTESFRGHGFVYILKARLGTRTLTVNYPGRTKVTVTNYRADNVSYAYSMTPKGANIYYTVRAFFAYTNEYGRTTYVYSPPAVVSYSSLNP